MAIQIKFKVLEVHPDIKSATVHYYTDEYPAGLTLNVTFYEDVIPAGQELIDNIFNRAPKDWLELKSKIVNALPDMSSIEAIVGIEHTSPVVDISTFAGVSIKVV